MLFADILMEPGGFIAWAVVGLIAGWLAGMAMKGGGYGILGDIIVGLIGAMIGGFLVSFFTHGAVAFWGSVGVAFLGACICIAIVRAIAGRPAV
jgi:uncharacterized membrane protein YeaQ/YmgE (transglycosylase-associated protein family)